VEVLYITTEYIQLNQAIKLCGWAENGGHANELIVDGFVKVNGKTELQKRKKLYPGTTSQETVVEFNGSSIKIEKEANEENLT